MCINIYLEQPAAGGGTSSRIVLDVLRTLDVCMRFGLCGAYIHIRKRWYYSSACACAQANIASGIYACVKSIMLHAARGSAVVKCVYFGALRERVSVMPGADDGEAVDGDAASSCAAGSACKHSHFVKTGIQTHFVHIAYCQGPIPFAPAHRRWLFADAFSLRTKRTSFRNVDVDMIGLR